MHLDQFFEERILQDEAIAKAAIAAAPLQDSRLTAHADGRVAMTGWRLLAEASLKREVLFTHDDYVPTSADRRPPIVECVTCQKPYPCQTLRIAVAVYADHPSYHPGWRPIEPETRAD
ncbi:hypothetical protein ASD62_15815 [Phycicoccus sp. Root563]|uniref:DUF6221 family protein n=1 Tax=Phycicoccus sp. Root563 TaxID=1736562 RepID=UPI00070364AE|nr:DUF6221 family protein [Phycicoccus sp. Root563]KQZ90529.1 hypothetical protein ASD62_15815 [Phycicoccus sp. Root563]